MGGRFQHWVGIDDGKVSAKIHVRLVGVNKENKDHVQIKGLGKRRNDRVGTSDTCLLLLMSLPPRFQLASHNFSQSFPNSCVWTIFTNAVACVILVQVDLHDWNRLDSCFGAICGHFAFLVSL